MTRTICCYSSLIIALCLSGCTIIHIEGTTRVTQIRPGLLRVEPTEAARLIVYRSRGLGIVPGRNGLTFGAQIETAALVYAPDDCHMVLFDPDAEQVRKMIDMLASISPGPASICTVGRKSNERTVANVSGAASARELRHD